MAKFSFTTRKEKPQKTRRKKGGRGILWLIVLCLSTSAGLRFGAIGSFAIAEGASEIKNNGALEATAEPTDEDIAAVLALLRDREAKLAEKESALEERAQALAVAETQVRKNLDALAQAEADLERMIALSSSAAEDDLARLTTVYENMKPKQAALVFTEMAPEFAAGFLGRMRADAAAAIMAAISPEKAYAISVLLASRNASAPVE